MKRHACGHRRFARAEIARLASGQAARAELIPAAHIQTAALGIDSQ